MIDRAPPSLSLIHLISNLTEQLLFSYFYSLSCLVTMQRCRHPHPQKGTLNNKPLLGWESRGVSLNFCVDFLSTILNTVLQVLRPRLKKCLYNSPKAPYESHVHTHTCAYMYRKKNGTAFQGSQTQLPNSNKTYLHVVSSLNVVTLIVLTRHLCPVTHMG